ncbi:MAG: hypothetical protein Q4F25_06235, partial [Eubacteriales bacterium]|nr:hypothetical protein [Eubacteriales bacterium]
MKKNHISARMKRILAIACAAALVCSSVPAGTYAYADEAADTEESVKADHKPEEKAEDEAEKVLQEETAPASKDENPEEEAAPAAGEKKPEEDAPAAPAEDEAKQNIPAGEEAKEDPQAKDGQPAPASGEENEEAKPADGKSGGASDAEKPQDEEKEPEDKDSPKAADREAKKAAEQKKTSKSAKNEGEDIVTITSINKGSNYIEFVTTYVTDWIIRYKYKDTSGNTKDCRAVGSGLPIILDRLADGTYYGFEFSGTQSFKVADNISGEIYNDFIIDNTAPKVTDVKLSDDGNSVLITIEEANMPDKWTYSYKKPALSDRITGTFTGSSGTITPANDGGYYTDFKVEGQDKYGNDLTFGTASDGTPLDKILAGLVVDQDAAPPRVTAVTQSEDKKVLKISIDEANISDQGWTISFKRNGSNCPTATFKDQYELTIDLSGEDVLEGVYTDFKIEGKDAAGKDLVYDSGLKEKLDNIEIVVDRTPPDITLTSVVADEDGNDQYNETLVLGKEKVVYTF